MVCNHYIMCLGLAQLAGPSTPAPATAAPAVALAGSDHGSPDRTAELRARLAKLTEERKALEKRVTETTIKANEAKAKVTDLQTEAERDTAKLTELAAARHELEERVRCCWSSWTAPTAMSH